MWLLHRLIVMFACPAHSPLIEDMCPHKGKYDCRIWNCPAHYDLADQYMDHCKHQKN